MSQCQSSVILMGRVDALSIPKCVSCSAWIALLHMDVGHSSMGFRLSDSKAIRVSGIKDDLVLIPRSTKRSRSRHLLANEQVSVHIVAKALGGPEQ
jgi:hypothetical protein